MEEKNTRLRDVGRQAGITADQAKYWARLLGISPVVRSKVGYLSTREGAILSEMAQMVAGGATPKEAADKLTGSVPVQPASKQLDSTSPSLVALAEQMKAMEQAFILVADELKTNRAKMDTLILEMENVRRENAALRLQLVPPAEPAKPVMVWQPDTPRDPLEGASWFERLYISVLRPERLRRYQN